MMWRAGSTEVWMWHNLFFATAMQPKCVERGGPPPPGASAGNAPANPPSRLLDTVGEMVPVRPGSQLDARLGSGLRLLPLDMGELGQYNGGV